MAHSRILFLGEMGNESVMSLCTLLDLWYCYIYGVLFFFLNYEWEI